MTSLITALFCCRSRSALFRQTWHTHPCRSVLCGLSPFQVCGVSADLEHSPSPEASLWPVAVPGLRSFSRLGTHSPAEHSLRPLLVPGLHRFDRLGTLTPAGAFSAASPRSRSAEFRQTWNTLARGFSMAGCRSRSAEFQQTWHTHPCRSVLCGLFPFQVCTFSTDLAHSPSPKASP